MNMMRDDIRHMHQQAVQGGYDREPLPITQLDLFQKMLDALRDVAAHTALTKSLLEDMVVSFHEGPPPPESFDINRTITLYKVGSGGNWLLNKEHRQYCFVWAPVATIVNITSSIGPPFLVTIPAITLPQIWNRFDFDDQASIWLDNTASASQMNIKVRLTNVPNLY